MLAGINSGFRRDILRVLHRSGGMSGAEVQRELESRDYDEIVHVRVYDGLEALRGRGLVEKESAGDDRRSNEYRLAERARSKFNSDWRQTA